LETVARFIIRGIKEESSNFRSSPKVLWPGGHHAEGLVSSSEKERPQCQFRMVRRVGDGRDGEEGVFSAL